MYYGRYSREARRWLISWPLPSEILAHPDFRSHFKVETPVEASQTGDSSDDSDVNQMLTKRHQ